MQADWPPLRTFHHSLVHGAVSADEVQRRGVVAFDVSGSVSGVGIQLDVMTFDHKHRAGQTHDPILQRAR